MKPVVLGKEDETASVTVWSSLIPRLALISSMWSWRGCSSLACAEMRLEPSVKAQNFVRELKRKRTEPTVHGVPHRLQRFRAGTL